MPDTLISLETPSALPQSTATQRKSRSLMKPTAFIQAVLEVATPMIAANGRPSSFEALAKALAPIFAGYTVADGFAALALVRSSVDGGCRLVRKRQFDALCEVTYLLEGFVSFAWATGPDCVSARAALLMKSTDAPDDKRGSVWALSEEETKGIIWRLYHEVRVIEPSLSATFDDCLKPHCSWLSEYVESLPSPATTPAEDA